MNEEINELPRCRACDGQDLYRFYTFGSRIASLFVRSENWKNYVCPECGAISHFLDDSSSDSYVSYSNSAYRDSISVVSQGKKAHAVNQPISLPWSTITSLRARIVAEHLSSHIRSSDSRG